MSSHGRYRLADVVAGARTLTVRRVGYGPAERLVMVTARAATEVDFALGAVASRLNEVVTTVTGPHRRLEVGDARRTSATGPAVVAAPP
jgi:hypothetical protein